MCYVSLTDIDNGFICLQTYQLWTLKMLLRSPHCYKQFRRDVGRLAHVDPMRSECVEKHHGPRLCQEYSPDVRNPESGSMCTPELGELL